jgi:4-hydroxy-tetrahydrodipicolinate reductase
VSLRIVIAGSTGWVGRELVDAIVNARDLRLVGAVARSAAGQDAAAAIGKPPCGVTISKTFDTTLASSADVLIDYTRGDIAKQNCLTALSAGCSVVLGSSGLRQGDFIEIDRTARAAGAAVLAAGNFSITAALLKRFSLEAATYIADMEIIDYAAGMKPDAPSGTSVELADALAQIRDGATTLDVDNVSGSPGARGEALGDPRPVQVHAVRLPSYHLSVETVFGADGERLTIRHDAGSSATPYVVGTLLAARHVCEMVGLTRGLDDLIERFKLTGGT